MVDVNLLGLLYCTHAALPLIGASGRRGHRQRLLGGGPARRAGAASTTSPSSGCTASRRRCARRRCTRERQRDRASSPASSTTELQGHNVNPVVQQAMESNARADRRGAERGRHRGRDPYAVTGRRMSCLNEVLVRPTGQRALGAYKRT